MSLVNYLNLLNSTKKYLKIDIHDNIYDEKIIQCLKELEDINEFKFIYKEYDYLLDFLNHPSYLKYLNGSTKYLLVASTLGLAVERRISYLSKTNNEKMVIMDAASSCYLEFLTDKEEEKLNKKLDYRFCPGYSKTDVNDNKIIFKILNASKIGIEVLPSSMMVPQKSMIGVVRICEKD